MAQKTIDKNNKWEGNPRTITISEQENLKEHLKEFGDLSGVVYCVKNKAFVGGNQRSDIFDGAKIEIVEKFDKPTANKTVALGFIHFNGEKYAYREVSFTKKQFKKACIVANNDGGSFDWEVFKTDDWDFEELEGWGVEIPEFEKNKIIVDGDEKYIEIDEVFELAEELGIEREYILIVFENNNQFQEAKEKLKLNKVIENIHNKKEINISSTKRILKYENLCSLIK